jgi:hypothetical protein
VRGAVSTGSTSFISFAGVGFVSVLKLGGSPSGAAWFVADDISVRARRRGSE